MLSSQQRFPVNEAAPLDLTSSERIAGPRYLSYSYVIIRLESVVPQRALVFCIVIIERTKTDMQCRKSSNVNKWFL